MLKGRIAVRELLIEVEADTKLKLEDALEAALNVAMRVNIVPQKAYREPETPATPSIARESPPVHAGGDNSPKEALQQEVVSNLSEPDQRLTYEGAKRIADYVRIALADLGNLQGTRSGYTAAEILKHMQDTGGDVAIKNTSDPTSAVRQAIRNSDYFLREDKITWLKEWEEKDETETEDSGSQELVKLPQASSFDF